MSRKDLSAVILPRGLIAGERRCQTAVLRPMTGFEEEMLAATAAGVPTAERVTALLARCLARLGPDRVGADQVRSLTVGDREALLLQLRRATLGEQIDCLLTCPAATCNEQIDVELRTEDLLLTPYAESPVWYDEEFPVGDRMLRVRFRLPTGADQEAVAALADIDPEAAAAELLRRCLDQAEEDAENTAPEIEKRIGPQVAARMAALDPQAEIRLQLKCPACQAPIQVLFDTATFFINEMAASLERLYDEVHTMAWYYHWGEGEILNLTTRKRRWYLERIAASLSKGVD